MVANCKCDSSIFQEEEKNKTENDKSEYGIGSFKDLSKFIISNLLDFNYEVIKCYNLIFNIKILRHNIGFKCLSIMLFFQIISFFIYLIRKVESIKNFMIIYNDLQKINKKKNSLNKNSPPKKNIYIENTLDNNHSKNKNKIQKELSNNNYTGSILNNVSNNLASNINIQIPILNINNKNFKKLKVTNKKHSRRKTSKKHKISSKNINKLDTITKSNNNMNKYQINKIGLTRLLKNDEEMQNMEYEEAILYDK